MSADPPAPSFVLGMFPYPSGSAHVGHVRVYGITDAVARHARLHGHPVLHPLGWDAFGLPAENAARRRGVDPAAWTAANIEGMRASFDAMGWAFDADHEIDTSSAEYMRWTQWLFLRMLQHGLAVRQPAWVAWCDACATVLADEQVSDGTCWRCDGPVRREQRVGWSFRITAYAQALWDGLDSLQDWDAEAVAVQRHWIGRTQGVRVRFASPRGPIETYTTRVDTLPGVVAIVLAPEHPAVDRSDPVVGAYARKASGRTDVERMQDRERSGVPAGFDAVHPLTGERVVVWVADYVIAGHGTGAVMCVPAHDRRDHAFATQVGLPVPVVVEPEDGSVPDGPFTGDGKMTAASGTFAGLRSEDGRRAITAELEASGAGDRSVVFRLRDWSVGRQRRWGCPIPVVHCPACGVVPVPDRELPVAVDAEADVACPVCGGASRRESDTLDTFVDSAWYAFRFTDPHATTAPFSRRAADRWMPIHTYVGGLEHAAQHMLYFRFFTRVLHEWGLVGSPEPVSRFVCNGMVLGTDGRKMSKARGNGVLPDDVVASHGADALRLPILADVPVDRDVAWENERVVHKERFLRVFGGAVEAWLDEHPEPAGRLADATDIDRARRIAHEIEALDADLARVALQSGVARLHTLANLLRPWLTTPPAQPRARAAVTAAVRDVLTVFLPFAPEWATALLVRSGGVPTRWPRPQVPAAEVATVVLQVGGRKVAVVEVDVGADDATLRQVALEHDAVRARIGIAEVRRVIVVPGRLVNVVP